MIRCLILWLFLFSVTPEPQSRTRRITKVNLHLKWYYPYVWNMCMWEISRNVLALNRRAQQQEMLLKVKYSQIIWCIYKCIKAHLLFSPPASGGFGESADKERRILPSAAPSLQVCSAKPVVHIHTFVRRCCIMRTCFCRSTPRATSTLAALNSTTLGLAQFAAWPPIIW